MAQIGSFTRGEGGVYTGEIRTLMTKPFAMEALATRIRSLIEAN